MGFEFSKKWSSFTDLEIILDQLIFTWRSFWIWGSFWGIQPHKHPSFLHESFRQPLHAFVRGDVSKISIREFVRLAGVLLLNAIGIGALQGSTPHISYFDSFWYITEQHDFYDLCVATLVSRGVFYRYALDYVIQREGLFVEGLDDWTSKQVLRFEFEIKTRSNDPMQYGFRNYHGRPETTKYLLFPSIRSEREHTECPLASPPCRHYAAEEYFYKLYGSSIFLYKHMHPHCTSVRFSFSVDNKNTASGIITCR